MNFYLRDFCLCLRSGDESEELLLRRLLFFEDFFFSLTSRLFSLLGDRRFGAGRGDRSLRRGGGESTTR